MPFVIVPIEGDPGQVAGRLALAGVQSVVDFRPPGKAAARLRADDPDQARARVRTALGRGEFAVGVPEVEQVTATHTE